MAATKSRDPREPANGMRFKTRRLAKHGAARWFVDRFTTGQPASRRGVDVRGKLQSWLIFLMNWRQLTGAAKYAAFLTATLAIGMPLPFGKTLRSISLQSLHLTSRTVYKSHPTLTKHLMFGLPSQSSVAIKDEVLPNLQPCLRLRSGTVIFGRFYRFTRNTSCVSL